MKKQDPNTGLTIDVPDSTPPLGKFPYSGFWAAIYGRVPANLQARTGSRVLITDFEMFKLFSK